MNKEPERANMVLELLGKREGVADQASTALAEGVIEAFNMIGQASFFADRTMTFGGKDLGIGLPKVSVENSPLSILRRQRVP